MRPELELAAIALLEAFGGDYPDWIREEAERLDRALEALPHAAISDERGYATFTYQGPVEQLPGGGVVA